MVAQPKTHLLKELQLLNLFYLGDIKPQNVLVYPDKYRRYRGKIIDFGHSRIDQDNDRRVVGTRIWRPPNWREEMSHKQMMLADDFRYESFFA
jgi:serine/threonine protein kinase